MPLINDTICYSLLINALLLVLPVTVKLGITCRQINMLDPRKKQAIIKKFKTHNDDTGSPQVQVAILTEEIKELSEHLKSHKKDFSSRRGLFRKVNQRRKLLQYLAKTEEKEYEKLVEKLKLKKKIEIPGLTDKKEEIVEKEPIDEEINIEEKNLPISQVINNFK